MKLKVGMALTLVLLLTASVSASFRERLVESVMETILPWAVKLMLYPLMIASMWMIKGILYFNPTTFCYEETGCTVTPGLDALLPYIVNILIPVYIIAMMFVALFFIAKSGSPRGRARARKMFFRLIMGMLMVIYAPFIYQAMLDISGRITAYYLEQVSMDKLLASTSFGKAVAMCYLQFCMFIVALVTVIILLVRWFYVYIYALFFPLILFLYFFEVTKPYGSKYLKQAVKWIFVPPLQALTLYLMVQGPLMALGKVSITGTIPVLMETLFGQLVGVFVVLAGMITICAAPLIMTKIVELVGTALYSVGLAVDNLPLMSVGGMMAYGTAGLPTAHAHFTRIASYDQFRSSLGRGGVSSTAPARMMGGERGAVEGRGGGAGQVGAAPGGGYAPAAPRRGTGGPIPPREGEGIPAMDRKAGEEAGKVAEESRYMRMMKRDIEPMEKPDLPEGKGRIPSYLESARMGGGLSPADLHKERKYTGSEGVYDYLKSRGSAATFAGESTRTQSSMIQQTGNAINALASAGVPTGDLAPLNAMQGDMMEVHRLTTLLKKPDEIKEGDVRIRRDVSERQKSLEENARKAKERMVAIQKQFGEKESLKREIAYLEKLLKDTKMEENKLAPMKKVKKGKK